MRVCPRCHQPLRDEEAHCPDDGAAAPSYDVLPEGTRLGAFRVVRPIGEGGMGAVYEAVHETVKKRAAVKVLFKRMATHPGVLERFVREAQAASRIEHPNVIGVYDLGRTPDGSAYMVMELLQGKAVVDAVKEQPGGLPLELCIHVARESALALAMAHDKNVVHRDFKPGNIFLVDAPGPLPEVKVLDFGIARLNEEGSPSLTRAGQVLGTPHFMAPEQAMATVTDRRADVYAWGAVLVYMTTGQVPYPYKSIARILAAHVEDPPPRPSERKPGLPKLVDDVVARAMAKDPAARYQSMREAYDALAPLAPVRATDDTGEDLVPNAATAQALSPALAPALAPVLAPAPAAPAGGRAVALVAVLALLVLAGAGAAAFFLLQGGEDDDEVAAAGDKPRKKGGGASGDRGPGPEEDDGDRATAGPGAGDPAKSAAPATAGASVSPAVALRAAGILRDALGAPATRADALLAVGDAPSTAGAALAAEVARTAPPAEAAKALVSLGRAHTPVMVEALRVGLARKEPAVKLAAAVELARSGDKVEEARPLLRAALGRPDAEAILAALALGALRDPEGIERLRAILRGSSKGIHAALRAEAHALLAAAGDAPARASLRGQASGGATPAERLLAAEALLRIRDMAGRAPLLELLAASAPDVRVAAARALAVAGDAAGREVATLALASASADERRTGVSALALLGAAAGADAADRVVALLDSEGPGMMRWACAAAILAFADERAGPGAAKGRSD